MQSFICLELLLLKSSFLPQSLKVVCGLKVFREKEEEKQASKHSWFFYFINVPRSVFLLQKKPQKQTKKKTKKKQPQNTKQKRRGIRIWSPDPNEEKMCL